jgi:hypothetical protein
MQIPFLEKRTYKTPIYSKKTGGIQKVTLHARTNAVRKSRNDVVPRAKFHPWTPRDSFAVHHTTSFQERDKKTMSHDERGKR